MVEMIRSPEYLSFRSSVPQKKVIVDEDGSKVWTLYDAGPRSVKCPLICLPPVSGTADIFYRQLLAITARGYRVIAVEHAVYWTVKDWCEGFRKLLDSLGLDKIHLFGASLGGFLAQKFAEHTAPSGRVHSLILCNTFCDTSVFQYTDSAYFFWLMPAVLLKKLVMGSFPNRLLDAEIADSVDFMVEKLEGLKQQELASRLTLNCLQEFVQPARLQHIDVTVIDVFDDCALTQQVKDSVYKSYPQAKLAHLKSGGNFPYLSRSDEVNLHLLVHLRKHDSTKYSARDDVGSEVPAASTSGEWEDSEEHPLLADS